MQCTAKDAKWVRSVPALKAFAEWWEPSVGRPARSAWLSPLEKPLNLSEFP